MNTMSSKHNTRLKTVAMLVMMLMTLSFANVGVLVDSGAEPVPEQEPSSEPVPSEVPVSAPTPPEPSPEPSPEPTEDTGTPSIPESAPSGPSP